MILDSSAPGASDSPSSSRGLQVVRDVGHGFMLTELPGPRKCGTRNRQPVQWEDVQQMLEQLQFNKRVKWVREALKLSHEKAAERWGYSKSQIIAWEKGRGETTWTRWNEIEKAALAELFGDARRTGT